VVVVTVVVVVVMVILMVVVVVLVVVVVVVVVMEVLLGVVVVAAGVVVVVVVFVVVVVIVLVVVVIVVVKLAEQQSHCSSKLFRAINAKNTNRICNLIIPSTRAKVASIYRPDMTLPSPHFPTNSNLRRSKTETVVYGYQRSSTRLERNDFTELILTELGSIYVSRLFFLHFYLLLINYLRLI
jgi:hypothetical protein